MVVQYGIVEADYGGVVGWCGFGRDIVRACAEKNEASWDALEDVGEVLCAHDRVVSLVDPVGSEGVGEDRTGVVSHVGVVDGDGILLVEVDLGGAAVRGGDAFDEPG